MLPGIEQLVAQCAPDVAPVTMLAIVRVESGGQPWALNLNAPKGALRLPRPATSAAEAERWASRLVAAGESVDIGLMQVNSMHLPRLGLSVAQLLDPCTNLAAGARILAEFYGGAVRRQGEGQAALQAAISAYNTGNHLGGFRNGYVGKVKAAAYRPEKTPLGPLSRAATRPAPAWGEPLVYTVRKSGY